MWSSDLPHADRQTVGPVVTRTTSTGLRGLFSRLSEALRQHRAEAEARARLHSLSDRDLADIGLTRDAIDSAVGGIRHRGDRIATETLVAQGGVMTSAIHILTRAAGGAGTKAA